MQGFTIQPSVEQSRDYDFDLVYNTDLNGNIKIQNIPSRPVSSSVASGELRSIEDKQALAM